MTELRREPFRLLFPIGLLLALAGVLPWLLFGLGVTRAWLAVFHALTMTQGFLIAVAAGFLGTMLPRRTGAPPFARAELALLVASLVLLVPALLFDHLALAEVAYLVALGTLAQFAVRRLRRSVRVVPPSFVFIPCALAGGIAGAALLFAAALGAAPWTIGLGRVLVEEGVIVPLVLALAPMLTPILFDGEAQVTTRGRGIQLALATLFAGSFALQPLWPRVGELVRGLVAVVQIAVVADVVRRPSLPGLHRYVYQLALLLVPLGLLGAATVPEYRPPLLHLSFIGGLSLLVFAVGAHVTFLHTGHDELARKRPWPVAAVTLLTLAATYVRVTAERSWAQHYVGALTTAALLWLSAALLWVVYFAPMLWRRRA